MLDRTLKEITLQEFLNEIEGYFHAGGNDILYLKNWLIEKNLFGVTLFRFLWFVIDSHPNQQLPALGKFNEYLRRFTGEVGQSAGSLTEHNQRIMKEWDSYDAKRIVDILIMINQKIPENYSTTDHAFLNKFGHIYCELCVLKELEKCQEYIKDRLESLIECIKRNQPYVLTRNDDTKMPVFKIKKF